MVNGTCCFCFRRENLTNILNAPENYLAMIFECFQIKLMPSDAQYNKHAYTICKLCIDQLKNALSFRMQVQSCVIRFQSMQPNISQPTNSNTNLTDFQELLDMQVDYSDDDEQAGTSESDLPLISKVESLQKKKGRTKIKKPQPDETETSIGNVNIKNEQFSYNIDKTPPQRLSTSETDKKRCRKSVTLETKLEVLRRIEAGEKIVEICKAMGLAKSTIQTIRDRKEDIKTYLQSAAPLNVSKLTRQRNWIMEEMEKLLIIWIEDNNKRRMPVSQMTIQEKALNIFENLKNRDTDKSAEDVTFQASRGWFEKFKNRFNLHNLKMKGEEITEERNGQAGETNNVGHFF